MKIPFERAYRVVLVDGNGAPLTGGFAAVAPRIQRAVVPNTEKRTVGDYVAFLLTESLQEARGFFGTLLRSDGDVFEFKDTLAERENRVVVWRFETLTLDRLRQLNVTKLKQLLDFAKSDEDVQEFYLANYLEDWWKPEVAPVPEIALPEWAPVPLLLFKNLLEGLSVASIGAKKFFDLGALFEAKKGSKKKAGFPPGTVRTWKDGDHKKLKDGTWVKVTDKEGAKKASDWVETSDLLPKSTLDKFFPGGKPTPERALLHTKIIAKFFEGKKPAAAGEKPVAVLTMGVPASGKTTTLEQHTESSAFVRADADLIKREIPEFQAGVSLKVKSAANVVHDESRYVTDEIMGRAIAGRFNFSLDGLGKDKVYYRDLIEILKDAGYFVSVIMTHVSDPEIAVDRSEKRGRAEGRFVNPAIIRENAPVIPKNFRFLSGLAHDAHLYLSDDIPPKIMWSKRGDDLEIHDSGSFASFLKLAEHLIDQGGGGDLNEGSSETVSVASDEVQLDFLGTVLSSWKRLSEMPSVFEPGEGLQWPIDDPLAAQWRKK